jgi:hypothetical protein
VAGFKVGAIELELIEDGRTLPMIPAVGQQDSAYIEEDYVEGEHGWQVSKLVS